VEFRIQKREAGIQKDSKREGTASFWIPASEFYFVLALSTAFLFISTFREEAKPGER
jgi:hypothetical protein